MRSCYALPMVTSGELAGALVLYGRRPGAFGPEEIRRAERFARNAAGALTLALRLASCADQNDQLRSSIMSRAVIDQALGVIMATQRCPQDKAFALLRSVSQNTNVKIRDLATSIVSNVSGEQAAAAVGAVRGRLRPVGAQPQDWLAGPGKPASQPHWIAERTFRRGDAPEVRRFAQAFGSLAGLRGGQLPDFVLAVNEAAACATARRPGTVRVRLCAAAARVYCEIRGDSPVMGSTVTRGTVAGGTAGAWEMPGGRHGEEEALRRRVLRLVCDYFRVTSGPEVTRVMLTMAVRRASRDPSGQAGKRPPR